MTYLLQIMLGTDRKARIGSLGGVHFKKGTYFYVGSAKVGLKARIRRHLSRKKNIFWHIDHLLSSNQAKIKKIWINARAMECQMAREFKRQGYDFIKKFGSSDCPCKSHLFFIRKNISEVQNLLKSKGFKNADKSSFR